MPGRGRMVRRGGIYGAAAGVAGAVGRAVYKRAAKKVTSYATKRFKGSSSSGGMGLGLTNQRDTARLYKARKRSWRSKRMGRFSSKVRSVLDKQVPSQIEIMRLHLDITASINTQQFAAVMLYGEAPAAVGTNDIGAGDLSQIVTNSSLLGSSASNKVDFKSAYLDMYITNTGLVPSTQALYIDVYTIYCRKDVYQYNGTADFYFNTFTDSGNLTGTSALTATSFGVTPFANPMFCSHFKIGEVKRVILAPGETYNTQMKDRKSRNYYYGKTEKVVCKKGWTKGFLLVLKGGAAYNAQDAASTIAIEGIRTYNYVVRQVNAQLAGSITI